jgi:WD40 repeat protein
MLASCDSDGIVLTWDVRMVKRKNQFDAGPYSVNSIAIDKSGSCLATANDDGIIKLFNESEKDKKPFHTLSGHEDAV